MDHTAMEANQYIKKLMPARPVFDANWINHLKGYCVFANDRQLPPAIFIFRNSRITQADGKNKGREEMSGSVC